MYEIFGRMGPFGELGQSEGNAEIVEKVRNPELMNPPGSFMRPDTMDLEAVEGVKCEDFAKNVMEMCWKESPENRPDFSTIRHRLKGLRKGKRVNIMDQMIEMLEKYSTNLEQTVLDRTALLRSAH